MTLSPRARTDLLRLYDWIADAASPSIALGYLTRVEAHLKTFEHAPERGERRNDIRAGLRVASFERRLSIAFVVGPAEVRILRVFAGSRDWASRLDDDA